jgi:eukaryotic-like serine/threonine-protein kinase
VADSGGFPRRFDSYVLLKPLARGGMGELYLAAAGARGLEKLCVIKKVLPNLVAPDNVQRFRDEAMVVVRLSHGNLVSVFDAGRHRDQVYLAMEFVDGKDLLCTWNRCAERRVPFPVDVAVYIVKELARGLAYAHGFSALKLVHRDVSPANVLLSYTGEVKLTDFGLATSTLKLQHTAPGIIFGKLSYLSPEQARSEPLDGRTDLYAAGILLWELLTGQQLFPVKTHLGDDAHARRDSTAEALERVRNPRVLPPSGVTSRVPPDLDRIVMRALAPERERRYQDGEELRADLAAFLAKTAPETDAARLASFLRPLFADDMEAERRARDALMQSASQMLSGSIEATGLTPAHGMPTRSLGAVPAASAPQGRSGGAHPFPGAAPSGRTGEDPRVGTTLGGRYYIRRLCGEGAMGRVYEGHHVDIGRRVAIKILHSSYRHSEEVVERFRREARAASKIGHPNIVDVTDSGTTPDGAFYFVMEYLDGVDLEHLIKHNGPLPVERALLITAQICRALQAAHDAEIVHRDLKPANVMLVNRKDEDDFVKVLDFGISRNLDLDVGVAAGAGPGAGRQKGLTRPDVAVGTPTYMSPEQAAGMPADALTDVYAVGGLLYEMLTAKPPCEGDDVLAVLNRKATEDPTPVGRLRPDLPADVQRLVTRALARAANERQPSMSALKEEVVACVAQAQGALPIPPVGPRPPGDPSTMKLWAFRPRPWMLAAGATTLAAVVALGWMVRRDSHDDEPGAAPPPALAIAAAAVARSQPLPAPPTAASAPGSATPPAAVGEPAGRAPSPVRMRPTAAAPRPRGGALAAAPLELAPAWPSSPPPPVFAAPAPAPAAMRRPAGGHAESRAVAPPPVLTTTTPGAEMTEHILDRGQVAFNEGNYAEAVRRAKEAVTGGAAVNGHLLLADSYYHLQRYNDAVREYQAVLSLEPANSLARRGRELAERAAASP